MDNNFNQLFMTSIKNKSSLALISLLFSIVLQAQDKDHCQKQIESIFSSLDTTSLETGLLVDVAFPFREIKLFNGKRQQERVLTLQDSERVKKSSLFLSTKVINGNSLSFNQRVLYIHL
jgi:hypothetical protein